jgi:sodium/potassium-transporting ATPase subunit alpha
VAYLGDQINEVKALNAANIGVSKGSSSDLIKHHSDVILFEDSFGSLVESITLSHQRFVNLKKSIAFNMTSKIPEIISIVMKIVFQVPLPFTTNLILIIDHVIDIFPSLTLKNEKLEIEVFRPRYAGKNILFSRKLLTFSFL